MLAPECATRAARAHERWRLRLDGRVQGVGFRPFVLRLARRLGIAGSVCNVGGSVEIEAEAAPETLQAFSAALAREAPPAARDFRLRQQRVAPRSVPGFEITISRGESLVDLPPDVATCDECLAELHDPADRRYRYPFTHCALCGPRWSLLDASPWDRARTTMREFSPCPNCAAEYADPEDRRCHAQAICCPDCGPRLELSEANGRTLGRDAAALDAALGILRSGGIVAVKSTGGFQLWVRAGDAAAVARLRRRKQRPHKPFAVMVADLAMAGQLAPIGADEAALLRSPAAPIVLLAARGDCRGLAPAVAADVPELGLMLPSSPLQTLLCEGLGEAVVATSGNLAGEPICIEDSEARARLGGIADAFLGHDRRILRALDDSIARIVDGRVQILRVGRGYAPLQLALAQPLLPGIALGGDSKAAVAATTRAGLVLSQHLGDQALRESQRHYAAALAEHVRMAPGTRRRWIGDTHPDYHVRAHAPADCVEVQHHAAHAYACLVEHAPRLAPPYLAFTWDGNGHGSDGTLWGGECLRVETQGRWTRLGSLAAFRLPGGDAAVRDPRRIAVSLLAASGLDAPTDGEGGAGGLWRQQLAKGFNAPWTSSAGRLFDGVAALIAMQAKDYIAPTYEGQFALALEAWARDGGVVSPYPLPLVVSNGLYRLDWRPLVRALSHDLRRGCPRETLAAAFHAALLAGLRATVRALAPAGAVALSGGVFQNRLLLAGATDALRADGCAVFWPERVPLNDGGLAAGQLIAACATRGAY